MGSSNTNTVMDESLREPVSEALARIPSGMWVLTAAHDDRRLGMLTGWVQQACFEPPMVTVAVAKGRTIMPLISESRQFGLCQLAKDDRLLMRKFAQETEPGEDPFLGLDIKPTALAHLPLMRGALSCLECELAAHMDVEGDHDIFVGKVLGGSVHPGEPMLHLREDGFGY